MKAKREPGLRTARYLRALLKRDDLTSAPTRRRTKWGFVVFIAGLALAGWLLAYWPW